MSFTRVKPTIPTMLLAERLVGEARTRRATRMDARERAVLAASALSYVAAAAALGFLLPNEREIDVALVVGLTLGYVLLGRIRFEFAGFYGTAEQLAIVPMLVLLPLPWVPAIIAVASITAIVPDIVKGNWHRDRLAGGLADCWFCIPPVLVLAALAPGNGTISDADVYALAFLAQIAGDFAWTFVRNGLIDLIPLSEVVSSGMGPVRVDAIFSPIAFLIAVPAAEYPVALLAIAPLTWLLRSFARDREDRYAKTLELHRAYRGTVMLLSDVVEFDDNYTAQHSRSVVELANAIADEIGVDDSARQELEFAAMLHDVGKISIPKEILNKPSALTDEEFELMKQHTIEGQFMLDRIGGLLGRVGEIVRSCHERWDGKGYPDGLAGEEIPLEARIVFVCDAYHAMTSDRSYRAAMPREAALAELFDNAGTQFDPRIVEVLAKIVQEGEPMLTSTDGVRAVLANTPVPQPELTVRSASAS
jgi:HD-GYP domain-containing protein (c-di-GMP phosphodiesterase class II)